MDLRLVLAIVAVVSLPGCILGRVRDEVPIDPEIVAKIRPGQSTKKDVVDLLGAPTYVNDRLGFRVLSPRGAAQPLAGQVTGPIVDELVHSPLDHSYTYEYTDTKSQSLYLLIVSFTNQETKRDRVVVFFDPKGVVSHVGKSFNAKDVEFRLPTSD
jgi:outer membrane protein assembly factor BamE (lipoprotein component of BamABCDE complex)